MPPWCGEGEGCVESVESEREQSRVSGWASELDHLQCETAAAAVARNGTLDALSDRLPLPSRSTLHLRFHLQACCHLKPHSGGGSSDLTRFCAFTACPAAAAGGGCCRGRPRGKRGVGCAVSIGGRGCNTDWHRIPFGWNTNPKLRNAILAHGVGGGCFANGIASIG